MLGEGGFATVFEAQHPRHGTVALKVLRDCDDAMLARFDREVRILAELRSPHTVRLIDHGRDAHGRLFAAFERLQGRELAEVLAERRLSPNEVEHVMRQVLQSLAEAHGKGVLHRDLKPENIFVVEPIEALEVRVLDFGIARPFADSGPSVTRTGEIIGTPRYMSPEQLTEKALTPASDLYSLGLIAFEMVMGSEAMAGYSFGAQLDRLRTGHVFSLPAIEAYRRLQPIIARMSARDPVSRYPSAQATLAALDGPEAGPIRQPTRSNARRRTPIAVLGVVAVVVVAAAAGAFAFAFLLSKPAEEPRAVERRAPPVFSRNSQPAGPAVSPQPVAANVDAADVDVDADGGASGSEGCVEADGTLGADGYLDYPKQSLGDDPRPLVVLIRDTSNRVDRFAQGSGFYRLADEHAFYVIAPIGYDEELWKRSDQRTPRRAIDHFMARRCVDPKRVYLVGHGRAGKLIETYTCQPWAGIATMSRRTGPGTKPFDDLGVTPCEQRPVPTLQIFGLQGDKIADCRRPPIDGHILSWASLNGCDAGTHRPYPAPKPLECREFVDCSQRFVDCRHSLGVQWPGVQGGNGRCLEPAPSFDAAQLIWDFFSSVR